MAEWGTEPGGGIWGADGGRERERESPVLNWTVLTFTGSAERIQRFVIWLVCTCAFHMVVDNGPKLLGLTCLGFWQLSPSTVVGLDQF